MLKVTQHYSENFHKCPVTEVELTGERMPFVAANVKRYSVKDPQKRELHDIFVKIAVAAYASGRRLAAGELGRAAIMVAQEAARAGFADMEFDLRTKEDRVRESEAAAAQAKNGQKPSAYSSPTARAVTDSTLTPRLG